MVTENPEHPLEQTTQILMDIHEDLGKLRPIKNLWQKLRENGLALMCRDAFSQGQVTKVIPLCLQAGVDPERLADIVSEATGFPRPGEMEIRCPAVSGKGWFLAHDGTCYMSNAFDLSLRKMAPKLTGSLQIKAWGVATDAEVESATGKAAKIVGSMEDSQGSQEDSERLLMKIMNDAISRGCSDIHLTPAGTEVLVRYRIDGDLETADVLNLDERYESLANTILHHASKNPGEYIAPVSAKFKWERGGRTMDIRMEMIPARASGKTVPRFVMRVLGGDSGLVLYESIGLPNEPTNPQQDLLLSLAHKPYGMLLVTGPTGSGKTTTLTALLRAVHHSRPNVSISTLEDPVEIEIPGIAQTEINEQAGMTFASGLRSMLRLDPDIILVGEIRDKETLDLGIRASLTGHLLLSTLHTNSAIGAIPRMLDMGADVSLLADSLLGVLAQRIVKTVCRQCAIKVRLSSLMEGGFPPGVVAPEIRKRRYADYLVRYSDLRHAPDPGIEVSLENPGSGCSACEGSGYSGRCLVSELVVVDHEIKTMISEGRPISAFSEYLNDPKIGFMPMWEHGMTLFSKGMVTLDSLEEKLGARQNYGKRFAFSRESRQV